MNHNDKNSSASDDLRACVSILPSDDLIKRCFDVIVSFSAIIFLLPILLSLALMIKLNSSGPILFRQERTGLNCKTFSIYKFRSMYVLESGHSAVQAKVNDTRVTAVGRFLRRTSLDELPQLFNILFGDMSIVGPRPHALIHDKIFSDIAPNYYQRFGARPGLTGLAQVRGYRGECHSPSDVIGRIQSDIEYIETWSLRLDASIIMKTIPLIFSDKNAY